MNLSLKTLLLAGSVALSSCNGYNNTKKGVEENTNIAGIEVLKDTTNKSKESDTLHINDSITISRDLIDNSMHNKQQNTITMDQILDQIRITQNREHAQYIASNYKHTGYGIDAIGVMVDIAKEEKDFEKAKYIASNHKHTGYGIDAIGVMVDIAKEEKDFEKAKYIASNHKHTGYGIDAIGVMLELGKNDREKLQYICDNFQGFGKELDAFLLMYQIEKEAPNKEQHMYLKKVAKRLIGFLEKLQREYNNHNRDSELNAARDLLGS